jgi:acetyl esterase/lipase
MRAFLVESLLATAVALKEGTYFISSKSSGLELQANDLGDSLVSTRFQSHDDYARFKVKQMGDDSYRLTVIADRKVLHADDLGGFQVATMADFDDEYSHFTIDFSLTGGHHVCTVASGRCWTLDEDGFLKTTDGTGDSFVFTDAGPSPSPTPAPSTGRGCFRDIVWDSSHVQTLEYVEYGSAVHPTTGEVEKLHLDAYFPPDSDERALRPAAVLVHGGGFCGGDRTGDGQPEFAMELVTRGFVAVSIDYRQLCSEIDLSTDIPQLSAVEDARAAVRYVRKMAKEWRVDPDRILMEGDSAGAMMALYMGYVKDAQGEGESGNPGYRSDIQLAVSVSGTLHNRAYCGTIHPVVTNCGVDGKNHISDLDGSDGQPPVFLIQGTEDYTQPYVDAKTVLDRAQSVGIPASMVTLPGARHVPWEEFYAEPQNMDQLLDFTFEQLDLSSAECPGSNPTMV